MTVMGRIVPFCFGVVITVSMLLCTFTALRDGGVLIGRDWIFELTRQRRPLLYWTMVVLGAATVPVGVLAMMVAILDL